MPPRLEWATMSHYTSARVDAERMNERNGANGGDARHHEPTSCDARQGGDGGDARADAIRCVMRRARVQQGAPPTRRPRPPSICGHVLSRDPPGVRAMPDPVQAAGPTRRALFGWELNWALGRIRRQWVGQEPGGTRRTLVPVEQMPRSKVSY